MAHNHVSLSLRRDREESRPRRTISSVELMGNGTELIIEHGGEEYRLRITRQEKLILTK